MGYFKEIFRSLSKGLIHWLQLIAANPDNKDLFFFSFFFFNQAVSIKGCFEMLSRILGRFSSAPAFAAFSKLNACII